MGNPEKAAPRMIVQHIENGVPTDRPTKRPTDQHTDNVTYRATEVQLKRNQICRNFHMSTLSENFNFSNIAKIFTKF